VYWTDWNDPLIRGATLDPAHTLFTVTSMPAGANAPLGRMALRKGVVYWAGQGPNAVWYAKVDGTQLLAAKVADKTDDVNDPDASIGVAVDDAHVYWSDAGKVRRLALGKLGSAADIEDFAAVVGAGEIAIDDARVYFTADDGVWSL